MIAAGLVKRLNWTDVETEFIETSFILTQPDQTSGDKLYSLYYFKTGHVFFFSQKAVALGIGNHERYSWTEAFSKDLQLGEPMGACVEQQGEEAEMLCPISTVQQTSVSQKSQSLVATLQKW